jgi:uncharacterized protein YndB with AHSA1/START domain
MSTSDREIVVTRLINAPRSRVWEVWTTPEHLANWWGPDGFTITTHSFDLRPGGMWTFTMHGPAETVGGVKGGQDFENQIEFKEIVEPERFVHVHGGDDGDGRDVEFLSTITFDDQDGKTLVTMTSTFSTPEERDRVIKEYGAIEGGKQTLGNLAAYVEGL